MRPIHDHAQSSRLAGLARLWLVVAAVLCSPTLLADAPPAAKPRAREVGIVVGTLPTGPWNSITDVAGVRVGQTTIRTGIDVRTGVTVVFPHEGNAFFSRVPAAVVVGNGFGKLAGSTQVGELGELESPIALTCTLCTWRVAEGVVKWMLAQPGMGEVRSINPVVGETNDGWALNAIRRIPVTDADVVHALESARTGPVDEGSVGAGTGTVAFGWKGGIGTSSRVVASGPWTVGVLVQTNFGASKDLLINGAPVGLELGRDGMHPNRDKGASGSVVVVVATDAPLSDRNLRRLAARAFLGLARTGAHEDNGSGDYAIAFSTNPTVRRVHPGSHGEPPARLKTEELGNDAASELYEATVDATMEAVYNSLLTATTESGAFATVDALPLEETKAILRKYNALHR
jgi:D-aminopeptidase